MIAATTQEEQRQQQEVHHRAQSGRRRRRPRRKGAKDGEPDFSSTGEAGRKKTGKRSCSCRCCCCCCDASRARAHHQRSRTSAQRAEEQRDNDARRGTSGSGASAIADADEDEDQDEDGAASELESEDGDEDEDAESQSETESDDDDARDEPSFSSDRGARLRSRSTSTTTRRALANGPRAGAARHEALALSSHPLFVPKARGIRARVLRFTPSWFAVTMGTSVNAVLLLSVPYGDAKAHQAVAALSAAFTVLSIALFATFAAITAARYATHPRFFLAMLDNEQHSLFLGTIPMGLVTIVTAIAKLGVFYAQARVFEPALALWWLALVLSVLTSFGVPFISPSPLAHSYSHASLPTRQCSRDTTTSPMRSRPLGCSPSVRAPHTHCTRLRLNLHAHWPVPPITVAASGAFFSAHLVTLDDLSRALTVLLASYVMCGVGLLLACAILVIYLQRLALHHLPPRELIVSTFLPLGPAGQGGFALIELGRVATDLFPRLSRLSFSAEDPTAAASASGLGSAVDARQVLASAAPAFYAGGIVTGLLLWGLGTWWALLAVVSIAREWSDAALAIRSTSTLRATATGRDKDEGEGEKDKQKKRERSVVFNMGWWSFTFPLGSLTLLTFSLGTSLSAPFFSVLATILTALVGLLWAVVFVPTCIGFVKGTLFPAPCLTSLPLDYVEKIKRIDATLETSTRSSSAAPVREYKTQGHAGQVSQAESELARREKSGTVVAAPQDTTAGEVLRREGTM